MHPLSYSPFRPPSFSIFSGAFYFNSLIRARSSQMYRRGKKKKKLFPYVHIPIPTLYSPPPSSAVPRSFRSSPYAYTHDAKRNNAVTKHARKIIFRTVGHEPFPPPLRPPFAVPIRPCSGAIEGSETLRE